MLQSMVKLPCPIYDHYSDLQSKTLHCLQPSIFCHFKNNNCTYSNLVHPQNAIYNRQSPIFAKKKTPKLEGTQSLKAEKYRFMIWGASRKPINSVRPGPIGINLVGGTHTFWALSFPFLQQSNK